jgi:hypothetical protein
VAELIDIFAQRGDLAHLALFLWATAASTLAGFASRELAAASRRFDEVLQQSPAIGVAGQPEAPQQWTGYRSQRPSSEATAIHVNLM